MIVDVGGGHGTACQKIVKKNPLLKFTVQDLPSVAEGAVAVSTSKCVSTLRTYQQSTLSTGTNLSPRQSEAARLRSKRMIFSLRNQSKTRTYSCSGPPPRLAEPEGDRDSQAVERSGRPREDKGGRYRCDPLIHMCSRSKADAWNR